MPFLQLSDTCLNISFQYVPAQDFGQTGPDRPGFRASNIFCVKFLLYLGIMGKLYPVGIQNFESLRRDGFFYVDKTALMYRLVTTGRYYFLSRPRRFGKSLLISTLEAYFQGKKELFDGLAVASLEREWKRHPVLHLDLNTQNYNSVSALEDILNEALAGWEAMYGANDTEIGFARRFAGVIRRAAVSTGERAVILVDEYDKPLLQTIGDTELQEEYKKILKSFYGALKSEDGYIRFALLTGVTKFGKVSVFSDLNNLEDISMRKEYADICGVSEAELLRDFDEDIRALALNNGQTYEQACAQLKEDYDGYHFCPDSPGIYNPFSLLNTFKSREYGSYWFETGTPTYLVELLKKSDYDLEQMSREETDSETLDSIFTGDNPIPVIYQSGYLTIKKYDKSDRTRSGFEIKRFVDDVRKGDIDGFMERLQRFLADCPYEMARDVELHYQNVLFIVFRLAGLYTRVEYHTSRGRIDMVVQTADYVYVMEFKLDGSAEQALQQIEEKQYDLPFAADSRKVFRIGVNFSSETRNIDRWIVE